MDRKKILSLREKSFVMDRKEISSWTEKSFVIDRKSVVTCGPPPWRSDGLTGKIFPAPISVEIGTDFRTLCNSELKQSQGQRQ